MSLDAYLEPPDEPEKVMGNCSNCDGGGQVANEDYDLEHECEESISNDGTCECVEVFEKLDCSECDGTGEVEQEECDTCHYCPCACDAIYDAWRDSRD